MFLVRFEMSPHFHTTHSDGSENPKKAPNSSPMN